MRIKKGRTPKENEVQTAIVASLQAYCRDNHIRCSALEYYPNQQGGDLRKVCADFLATLDDSTLLLAETKVHSSGELLSFDDEQLIEYLKFERAGFPIAYVYNTEDTLAYYEKPQPNNFPVLTLSAVNRSVPSLLPDRYPDYLNHTTLLEWLRSIPAGGDKTTRFARIFAAIRVEAILSNGLMMLIYGTEGVKIFDEPNPKKLELLLRSLGKGVTGAYLNPAQQKRIEYFLQEEAVAFNSWFQPVNPNAPQAYPLLPSPDDSIAANQTSDPDDDDDRPKRRGFSPRF
ncbi:hypothetical protein [Pseudomonas viridiflava]|uniref:hypothetical protein n=1 Tax=Pseudomonas viridiflava TaxID=33069 RepID=UPI002EBBFE01|nr:hypothetical protein [Pseudomonas viridiflava]